MLKGHGNVVILCEVFPSKQLRHVQNYTKYKLDTNYGHLPDHTMSKTRARLKKRRRKAPQRQATSKEKEQALDLHLSLNRVSDIMHPSKLLKLKLQ